VYYHGPFFSYNAIINTDILNVPTPTDNLCSTSSSTSTPIYHGIFPTETSYLLTSSWIQLVVHFSSWLAIWLQGHLSPFLVHQLNTKVLEPTVLSLIIKMVINCISRPHHVCQLDELIVLAQGYSLNLIQHEPSGYILLYWPTYYMTNNPHCTLTIPSYFFHQPVITNYLQFCFSLQILAFN
jgi:hypothetical protein